MKKLKALSKLTLIASLLAFTTTKLLAQKTDTSKTNAKVAGNELEAFLKKVQQYSEDKKQVSQQVGAQGIMGNRTGRLNISADANGYIVAPSQNPAVLRADPSVKLSNSQLEKMTGDFNVLQSQYMLQRETNISNAATTNEESILINKASKGTILKSKP